MHYGEHQKRMINFGLVDVSPSMNPRGEQEPMFSSLYHIVGNLCGGTCSYFHAKDFEENA